MTFPQFIDLFRRVIATICCIFGLPGNILTIIVCINALCHRTINFERKVFNLYLAEISILDTCLLLYWVIETLFHYLYSINKSQYFSLMHISPFSCFFFYMINRLFAALCSWLITCFTFIRFINIFQQLNTIRSNIILVICLTIIFSIANSYLMVTLDFDGGNSIQSYENSSIGFANSSLHTPTKCHIRDEYSDNQLTLLLNTLVAGVLNLALPSMLTLIVNIAIVCYIKRIYEIQTQFDPIPRRSDNSGLNYRSTRSTLLVISITYTLCYLPYCIIFLLLIQFDSNSTLIYCSKIAFVLRYISHSINFYAYIFTNQRFRRDILVLLRSIYRPCSFIKERNRERKKDQRKQLMLQHYRPPPMLSSKYTPANLISTQRKQQQHLTTPDFNFQRSKPLLVSLAPSSVSDKSIIKAHI
ncbi:hypothetical protein I4U23_030323 [Adineta vaga]|nr:hypothetical protein I4U23_030323 [Adineta vaga]